MAARINKLTHDEKTKDLIRASQLLNRLTDHANGLVELTSSQVKAAQIVIGKKIPDLKAIEVSGDTENPLTVNLIQRVIIDPKG